MPAVNAPQPIQTDERQVDLYLPDRTPKQDMRSKLIRSKEALGGTNVVPACPFCTAKGRGTKDMDGQGYCRHLIGFTRPDDRELFDPTKVRQRLDAKGNVIPERGIPYRYTDWENPEMVMPGDRLVEVSLSFRVYRDTDAKPEAELYVQPETALTK